MKPQSSSHISAVIILRGSQISSRHFKWLPMGRWSQTENVFFPNVKVHFCECSAIFNHKSLPLALILPLYLPPYFNRIPPSLFTSITLSTIWLPVAASSLSSLSPFPSTSSPGSDSASRCTHSSDDIPTSSVAVPLSLSLSPALSPEEFERLWLQQHPSHAEQGN